MNARFAVLAGLLAALGTLGGCEEPPPKRRTSIADIVGDQWTVTGGGGRTSGSPREDRPPAIVRYKPDTEIVHPIFEAHGKWTVRVMFFNANRKKRLSALHYANKFAKVLRAKGEEAYVTDISSRAIVSVGTFDDKDDPELIETWRRFYEGWLEIHHGRESNFRREMKAFYGEDTVFGDQPWPVRIIELQVKMKAVYQIPLTEEDKRRYRQRERESS